MDSKVIRMETTAEVKRRIKATLFDQNVSLARLAETSNIPYATLHRKMNTERGDFTLTELGQIADALNVSPVTLMAGQAGALAA